MCEITLLHKAHNQLIMQIDGIMQVMQIAQVMPLDPVGVKFDSESTRYQAFQMKQQSTRLDESTEDIFEVLKPIAGGRCCWGWRSNTDAKQPGELLKVHVPIMALS